MQSFLKNNIPFLSSPLITSRYTIILHSDLYRVGLPKRLQTGRHCGIGGWCAVTCILMLCRFPQHQIHLLDRDKRFKQSTKENRNRESRFIHHHGISFSIPVSDIFRKCCSLLPASALSSCWPPSRSISACKASIL